MRAVAPPAESSPLGHFLEEFGFLLLHIGLGNTLVTEFRGDEFAGIFGFLLLHIGFGAAVAGFGSGEGVSCA